jgi:thiol reductant ABC exporter CydC subunit
MIWRRVLGLTRGHRGRLTVAGVTGFATIASSIGLLTASAYLISKAALEPPILDLTVAIVGVRFFALARAAFRYGERLVTHDLSFRLLSDLRVRIAKAVIRLAPAGLEGFHSGDLLTRVTRDVDALQQIFIRVIMPPIIAIPIVLLAGAIGWMLLPTVGLIVVVTVAFTGVAVPWLVNRVGAAVGRRAASDRSALATTVVDLTNGAAEIVACGRQADFLERLGDVQERACRRERSGAWLEGIGTAAVQLMTGGAIMLALVAAIPAVRSGSLSGVNLAVVAMLMMASFEAVAGLPDAFQHLGASLESAERIFSVIDTPSPIREPSQPALVRPGGIELNHAWLRYDADWVLQGVSLRLDRGQRVALVGESGIGKTTIADVLVRFRDLDRGTYTIDGIDAGECRSEEVRGMVGMVSDDTHLFRTTLAENLRVGDPDADDDRLVEVLDAVRLGDWFRRLPDGLATEIGSGLVSGGEQRRIALARALLADFGVLILDEPTAGLDEATAAKVMDVMLDATRNRTTLLITHRLEGLEDMDEILVLEGGRITARGSHAELLASGGWYRRMWDLEAGELVLDLTSSS